jgi:hypothetical protein
LFYTARALELKPVTSFILRETAQVEKIRKRKREKKVIESLFQLSRSRHKGCTLQDRMTPAEG